MPILVSNQTPVNLLGRDALCKLGLQMWCSPEGVYIDTIWIETQMMVVEPKANVYWIGHIQPDVRQTIHKWGKFIEAQIPEAQLPKSEFHCTLIYDSEKDEKIEQEWQEETKEQQIKIVSQHIIIGKQGAALNTPDCEFVKKWFSVTDSVQHIAVYVGKNLGCKRFRTNDEKGRTKQMGTNRTSNDFSFSWSRLHQNVMCNKFARNSTGSSYRSKEKDADDYNIRSNKQNWDWII